MNKHGLSIEEQQYLDKNIKCYIGIDPGLSGAIATLNCDGDLLNLFDMPTMANGKGNAKVKSRINAVALYYMLLPYAESCAIVEQVSAMPGQGVSSMFSFGESFGIIRAVLSCLHMSIEFVTPQKWKKFYGIKAERKEAKEIARAKAIELYPTAELHLKKHADRAEAILMARYRLLNGERNDC